MLVSVPSFWGWHRQTTAVEIAGADGEADKPMLPRCGCLEPDDG